MNPPIGMDTDPLLTKDLFFLSSSYITQNPFVLARQFYPDLRNASVRIANWGDVWCLSRERGLVRHRLLRFSHYSNLPVWAIQPGERWNNLSSLLFFQKLDLPEIGICGIVTAETSSSLPFGWLTCRGNFPIIGFRFPNKSRKRSKATGREFNPFPSPVIWGLIFCGLLWLKKVNALFPLSRRIAKSKSNLSLIGSDRSLLVWYGLTLVALATPFSPFLVVFSTSSLYFQHYWFPPLFRLIFIMKL